MRATRNMWLCWWSHSSIVLEGGEAECYADWVSELSWLATLRKVERGLMMECGFATTHVGLCESHVGRGAHDRAHNSARTRVRRAHARKVKAGVKAVYSSAEVYNCVVNITVGIYNCIMTVL